MGAATNLNGMFIILNVPPGLYTVKAMMIGYQALEYSRLKVSIDLTTSQNFELSSEVINIGGVVTVVAERPMVRKDVTSSQAIVGADEIENLPVQEVSDVLELQAGLTKDAFGGLHVRGGRSGEVAYWVDGIAATDAYSGNIGIEVENSAVQELQVISGTFNAEYGNAMSAVVNIVTKEGGREYHGDISTYVGDFISYDDDVYYTALPQYEIIDSVRVALLDTVDGKVARREKKEFPLHDLNAVYNMQGSLSGPLPILPNTTFFVTGRYYSNEGYLYGQRRFTPQGRPGDGKLVSMNPYRKYSGQTKLTYKIKPGMKITYGLMFSDQEFSYYDHYNKYNPDNRLNRFEDGTNHLVTFTHTLSPTTFYEAKFTSITSKYKEYLYKDPLNWQAYVADSSGQSFMVDSTDTNRFLILSSDSIGYVHPDSGQSAADFSFAHAGTNSRNFSYDLNTKVAKFDLVSQITEINQLKFGIELRLHELTFDVFDIQPETVGLRDRIGYSPLGGSEIRPYKPSVHPTYSPYHDSGALTPTELSGYLQDKIELQDLIVNLGIRYDYFNPDYYVPTDYSDPDNAKYYFIKVGNDTLSNKLWEHTYSEFSDNVTILDSVDFNGDPWKYGYKKVSGKGEVSPRLAIAYPITERGVIHVSYGHFFQIPTFEYIYANPDFEVVTSPFSGVIIGNADLRPQKTVMYEIGLQQQFASDVSGDFTLFYRDIRDWVSTSPPIQTKEVGKTYSMYVNKDYENVRGFTVAINKRYANFWSANLDYSFMIAEGSASNPTDAYNSIRSGAAPRIQLIPMAWDQRHTVNSTVSVGSNRARLSLIGQFWSGTPYTPRFAIGEVSGSGTFVGLTENSARKPSQFNIDMKIFRGQDLGNARLNLYLYVYNLLDWRSVSGVYADTGDPAYSLDARNETYDNKRIGSVDENLVRPDFYSEPRQVQLGMSVTF